MTIEHMIAFNLTLLAAIASPGPALLVAIRTTLSNGRASGMAVGLGLGLVAAVWTLMALMGLDVIFDLFPWVYTTAKVVGALYLIYVAIAMWRGAKTPINTEIKPARHAFRQGVIINLLNPKSVLFAAAVLVIIFPENLSVTENLIIAGNHLIIEILFYGILALTMSTNAVSSRYIRAKVYLDRVAAGVLGALGLRIMLDR